MLTLIPLKLYTTSSCHLCEDAYALLSQLALTQQLTLVEISDNDALLASYELRIPVLQRLDTGAELNWPFNQDKITAFVTA